MIVERGEQQPRPRRRRRAVGPAGASGERAPDVDLGRGPERSEPGDEERLLRDRPPHHDRGV